MYEGDDPLNPYYQYIIWLEQSFPKMGRESNLMSVIEDAIIKFKDCDEYKQDPRFVKIMIKYVSMIYSYFLFGFLHNITDFYISISDKCSIKSFGIVSRSLWSWVGNNV